MKKELSTTVTISPAHSQPNRRCGIVPFGCCELHRASAKAASAAKACTWIAGDAASSEARVI